MIEYAYIWHIFSELEGNQDGVIGHEAFDKLVSIYPEGVARSVNRDSFKCRLPTADPRIKQIKDLLKSIGFLPSIDDSPSGSDKEYFCDTSIVLEPSDYETAEYFEFGAKVAIQGGLAPDGYLYVDRDQLPNDQPMAVLEFRDVFSSSMRNLFEKQGFKGLAFKEVNVRDEETKKIVPWPNKHERFWQVTSDIVLPPVSPSMVLADAEGKPFTGDFNKGCIIMSSPKKTSGLIYRRSDLAKAPAFDIARSHELWSLMAVKNLPRLVVSRRFYEFCERERLPLKWGINYVEEA